jgi:hypothetical protein
MEFFLADFYCYIARNRFAFLFLLGGQISFSKAQQTYDQNFRISGKVSLEFRKTTFRTVTLYHFVWRQFKQYENFNMN